MRLTHYDEHKKRWQINDDHGAVTIDELNYAVGEAIDKLADYEDAEEQCLLVRLPFKVGDTIHVPGFYMDRVFQFTVDGIHITRNGWYITADGSVGQETTLERYSLLLSKEPKLR